MTCKEATVMSSFDRLAVFIDYQNVYRGARQAFGEENAHHTVGQCDPLKLAKLIEQRHPSYPGARPRKLVQVWTYRGMPKSRKNPKGYTAACKQVDVWHSSAASSEYRVEVCTRPLDYRTGFPREKGIDVVLALDLAFGASNNEFDVGVLFSGDSDLLPALERAHDSGVACETALWIGGGRRQPQKRYIRWEHRLDQRDYDQAHDSLDYSR